MAGIVEATNVRRAVELPGEIGDAHRRRDGFRLRIELARSPSILPTITVWAHSIASAQPRTTKCEQQHPRAPLFLITL
jgi:hypothetical protein